MKSPRPASFNVPASAASSFSSASARASAGAVAVVPRQVLVAKPIAPARRPSSTMFLIVATSAIGRGALGAASPMTYVRTLEWPTNAAMFTAAPWRSSHVEVLRHGLELPADPRAQRRRSPCLPLA